jgi:chromosome segregation ATPase
MSGSYMRRIAYDKSGEFVEMCAKEDQLRGYLEAAIDEQVEIHKAIGVQRLKTERDALDQKRQRLRAAVAEKMAKIEAMRRRIAQQPGKVKRLAAAKRLLDFFKQRAQAAEREIVERRAAVARLEADVESQAALVQDMERTVCISGSVALAGRSGKVHIKFGPP